MWVNFHLTEKEERALEYWHRVNADFGEVKEKFDVDLIEVLNNLAKEVSEFAEMMPDRPESE